jgi:predicted metal-dependent hydrolase
LKKPVSQAKLAISQFSISRSSKRQTLSLQVKNSKVRVLAPNWLSEAEITAFVAKKQGWLARKLAEQNQYQALSLVTGSKVLFLGNEYLLTPADECQSSGLFDGRLYLNLKDRSLDKIVTLKEALLGWYQCQANDYLPQRIQQLAERLQLTVSSIKIRYYKTRWGGCNAKGQLSFNSLLMFAPRSYIDYLIIHELCHLTEFNHSAKFWALVEAQYPEHKQARRWFKNYSHYLELLN